MMLIRTVARKEGQVAAKPSFVIDADLLSMVKQIPDEQEAMEAWWQVTQWASEFFRQTGEPATINDLYQEFPGMLRDEEYEVDVA
jgi:hypothetical protein